MLAKVALSTFALAAAAGVYAQDNVPAQISGQPVIRWLCPQEDRSEFKLESFNYQYTVEAYFCSYPSYPGEDPFNFYCLYSQTTGDFIEDHNVGLCFATGVRGPAPSKKRALPRHHQIEERDMSDNMKAMRSVKRQGQKARLAEH